MNLRPSSYQDAALPLRHSGKKLVRQARVELAASSLATTRSATELLTHVWSRALDFNQAPALCRRLHSHSASATLFGVDDGG